MADKQNLSKDTFKDWVGAGLKKATDAQSIKLSSTPEEVGTSLEEAYKIESAAPFAALRSSIAEAQKGKFLNALKVPFTGGANYKTAPSWSDIAENAGVTNPYALAAVQTAGDVGGSQVGLAAGPVGKVANVSKASKVLEREGKFGNIQKLLENRVRSEKAVGAAERAEIHLSSITDPEKQAIARQIYAKMLRGEPTTIPASTISEDQLKQILQRKGRVLIRTSGK